MTYHSDIRTRDGTPFAPAPLVEGGIRIGGLLYASTELERLRHAAGGDLTVQATVDPADPVFAFAILPGSLGLVRAEAVFSRNEFERQARALFAVLDGIDALLAEDWR